MTATVAVALCLLSGFAFTFAFLLIRQNGRILIRLEALEKELVIARLREAGLSDRTAAGAEPHGPQKDTLSKSRINRNGLEQGSRAPDFSLPLMDGSATLSLEEYRGRPFLLIFASPDCGPCDELASRLARLPEERIQEAVLIISRGTPESNVAKFRHHRLSCPVVLQRSWEASRSYGTFKLPSAYEVDSDGVLATGVLIGPDEISAAAEQLVHAHGRTAPSGAGSAAIGQSVAMGR